MTYKLLFHERALKEWSGLQESVRNQFKAKLKERLQHPHVPSARLTGMKNRYKIKLKRPPLRLVYEVQEDILVVKVLVIGKRERSAAYKIAAKR